jgi:hypothetical protein
MMKLITRISLLIAVFAVFVAGAQAQSLGEAARKARKEKAAPSPAQKVYTNENLPSGPLSVATVNDEEKPRPQENADGEVMPAEASAEREAARLEGQQDGTAAASESGPLPDSKQDYSAWKTRIAEQKNKVELLERELGVLEREYRLRVAVFYADAGTRLRDDRKFADADRQYKSDLETKKNALAAAKQQLENIREEARKAGVPASVRE